jgi:hypothetical protein
VVNFRSSIKTPTPQLILRTRLPRTRVRNLPESPGLVRRSETRRIHPRSAAARVEGSGEGFVGFFGSLEFSFCDVSLHGQRRQTRPAATSVSTALLDVGLETGDVSFEVEHFQACCGLLGAQRTGALGFDRGEGGLGVGAGVEEGLAGGVRAVLTCGLGDGVDGAAEEEDVQAACEHVADVATCGLGRERHLQGELLRARAPEASVGG